MKWILGTIVFRLGDANYVITDPGLWPPVWPHLKLAPTVKALVFEAIQLQIPEISATPGEA